MGISISKIFESWFSQKEMRVLMLGLDAAGKTTILYKMKLGEVVSSVPTIGFNVDTVEYKNIKFNVWDIGGQTQIRLLWKHYYQNTQGLIFVVDSSDPERIDLAREELMHLLNADELRDCPLLVLANKQDMKMMEIAEITEKLGLHSIRGRQWYVQGACALVGEGIYDGFDWLSKSVNGKK